MRRAVAARAGRWGCLLAGTAIILLADRYAVPVYAALPSPPRGRWGCLLAGTAIILLAEVTMSRSFRVSPCLTADLLVGKLALAY